MSNDFRDLKSNTENENKENHNKKDKNLDILKDKLKNTDYKQKINDLDIESKAKFLLNKTKEGLEKTKEVYEAEETQIMLKKIMNMLYKLFRYYPLFLFKYRLKYKYVMNADADFMKDMQKKEKEEVIKDFRKKNLLETLYLYSPFLIMLLSIFFAYCLQNTGYGLKPLIFLNLILLIFPIYQHFRISTGRADVDTIINYYLEKGVGLSDLREIVEKYEEIRKDFRDIYLTGKSRIVDMTLDFDDKLGLILQLDLENASDKTINTLANIDYLKPFENFGEFYVVANNKAYIMFDIYLSKTIYNKEFDFVKLFKDNESYFKYFKDFEAIRKQKEIDKLKDSLKLKGIDNLDIPKYLSYVEFINKNQDTLGFRTWNKLGEGVNGNQYYTKIKCLILKNTPFDTIKSKKGFLETGFRKNTMFKQEQDLGSFDLYIINQAQLKPNLKNISDIKMYNEKGKFYLGESYTGSLAVDWNWQANHMVVAGGSGAGKSTQLKNILAQLAFMNGFDYSEFFILSSSKISDFKVFSENGALTIGETGEDFGELTVFDRIEKTLTYLLQYLKNREALFFKEGYTEGISEYNKKNPDKPLNGIVLLIDEIENLFIEPDKKQIDRLTKLLLAIANIARSSGCLIIIGSQSILKNALGKLIGKMFTYFSGKSEKDILTSLSPEINSFYEKYPTKPQGVFMYKAENLNFQDNQDVLTFGNTAFTLIQTPYIKDLSSSKIPKIKGKEHLKEILNGDFEVVLNDSEDNESVNQESIELNIEESENATNIESVENILDTIDLDL